jgi:hypothetical protein
MRHNRWEIRRNLPRVSLFQMLYCLMSHREGSLGFGSHADAGPSSAFRQGMMYQSSLMARDQSSMGQNAMAFRFAQSQQNAQQNFHAHQAYIASLTVPRSASANASVEHPPRKSTIPVDVTVRTARKSSLKEQWNEVEQAIFNKKPTSKQVTNFLHGGPLACCTGVKFRVRFSQTNKRGIPYVVFWCKCEGTARIKAAYRNDEWRLFSNQGGEHSPVNMGTTTPAVLLPVHME